MKGLMLIALTLPVTTFAAPTKETVFATLTLSVSDLRCVTPIGQGGETYTELGSGSAPLRIYRSLPNDAIQLKHALARGPGCPKEELDAIVERSGQFFGAQYDVPATIQREMRRPFRERGQCFAMLVESLSIELGPNTRLSSSKGKKVPADGCE